MLYDNIAYRVEVNNITLKVKLIIEKIKSNAHKTKLLFTKVK